MMFDLVIQAPRTSRGHLGVSSKIHRCGKLEDCPFGSEAWWTLSPRFQKRGFFHDMSQIEITVTLRTNVRWNITSPPTHFQKG